MRASRSADTEEAKIRRILPIGVQDAAAKHWQKEGLGDAPSWVEFMELPVKDMIAIDGIGVGLMERVAQKCQNHPAYHRIWEEWQHCPDNPNGYLVVEGERISYDDIKRARRKRAVMAEFGYLVEYGEGYGESWKNMEERFKKEVSDEQIAASIKRYLDSVRNPEPQPEVERVSSPLITESTITGLSARYSKELRQQYDVASAPLNDQLQVQHLADLLAARTYHDLKARDMMVATSGNFTGTQADDYAWLRRQIADLDAQISRIQKELGITPEARAKLQGTRQAWEEISQLIADTQELRATHINHWMDGKMTLGYGVWHFPTDEFMPRCANCGGQEFIAKSPNGPMVEINFATEASRMSYAEARRFVPDNIKGAPEGVFDHASTEAA